MSPSTCECCGREAEGEVAASRLGPVSIRRCEDCLRHNAEPEAIVDAIAFGTPDNLADWVNETITIFSGGEYLSPRSYYDRHDVHAADPPQEPESSVLTQDTLIDPAE